MASRIEGKRETSPISSAHVSAVIGPTPGTVLSCLIRSASKGSRCSELTRAYSVFCNRTMLSRLTRSRGRILSLTSSLVASNSRKYFTLCTLLVVTHSCLHQQTGDAILHLHHLAHQQVAVAQSSASVPNGGACHVALRQEVTAQAVGDLAGINPVVFLLGRSDGAQHQRMRYLHLLRVWK